MLFGKSMQIRGKNVKNNLFGKSMKIACTILGCILANIKKFVAMYIQSCTLGSPADGRAGIKHLTKLCLIIRRTP